MTNLHFYFMSDPKLGDSEGTPYAGALAEEKADFGHEIIIVESAQDLVATVLIMIQAMFGRIKSMKISAHGGYGSFHIGRDLIAVFNDGQPTGPLSMLGTLAPYFAPEANVAIHACGAGASPHLVLRTLSSMWGGVTVEGYTSGVSDWKKWFFSGTYSEGDTIVCEGNRCVTKPPLAFLDFNVDPGVLAAWQARPPV